MAVINVIMSARTLLVALCVPAVLDLSWMMMEFPVEVSRQLVHVLGYAF